MPNVSTGGEDPRLPDGGESRLLAQRYRLLTEVGHGGMGTVWHAHDEVLGRDVAVKEVILPRGLSDDERDIHHKRTFREARTAARLAHPGVVTVFDVVEEDGRPWIIMELIRARSLDQVIKAEGRLPMRRAAEIGRQMLGALHAAHEAGVLHRDVKPSNVLMAPGDRAVLTDFGIATAAGDATLTQTGLVMGSPAYIAPERARGRAAGPASDLWSLGITLYAMVEGTSPYERPEPMASLVAIISEEPAPSPHAGALHPVIDGLLRKEPAERMTAHEAAALLDQVVRGAAPTRQTTRPMEMLDDGPTPAPHEPAPHEPAPHQPAPHEPALHQPAPHQPALDESAVDAAPRTEPGPSPKTAPGLDQAPGARQVPRRRTALVIAAIVLTALLVLAVWAWLSPLGEPNGTIGSTQGTRQKATSQATASARPSATRTPPSSGVPAGFHLHKDPTGFSVAIPDGWTGPERSRSSVFFYAPGRNTYVQIDQTSQPGASALADWVGADRNGPRNFSNYHRVRLAATGNEPPVPDTGDGRKSADWEFTWDSGSTRKHVLDRGFVTNGHGYAILVSAPDSGWSQTIAALRPVFASFEPAGR